MVKAWFISLIVGLLLTGMIIGGCSQQAPATPTPTPTPVPAVLGEQRADLSSYDKIELNASQIEVSSTFENYGKENLIKELGFWHVEIPKETDEAWVVVDLGGEARLDVIAVRPRTEYLSHLWSGDAAVLEGSNDKQEWIAEVRLELNHEELNERDWIAFVLPEDIGSYRYYRLFISEPDFISMGGLALYGEGGIPVAKLLLVLGKQGIDLSSYGKIELDESQIEVSSTFENYLKENLIKEPDFWHVEIPRETDEAWVVVDLGGEARLDVLAIRPRIDYLEQLWRGDAAVLEGSNDKQEWIAEVKLELNHEELNEHDWIAFVLPEDIGSYRYYRLFITDPGFSSLGGLELYGEGGIPVVEPE